MTLVQNLRLLLNGNKLKAIFLSLLLLLLFNQSCFTRQIQKSALSEDVTITENEMVVADNQTEVVETPEVQPEDSLYPKIHKKKYNIAIALPFELDNIANEDYKQSLQSKISQDFYAGMSIYLDELDSAILPFTLEIFVQDIASYDTLPPSFFQKLKSNQIDFLIGPFKKEHLNQLSAYSIENRMTIISPFITDELQLNTNPYYISLKTSNYTTLNLLTQRICDFYTNYNVILLASSKAEIDNISLVIKSNENFSKLKDYNAFVLNNANWSSTDYLGKLNDSNNLVFCYIDNDLVAINSVLTNLSAITSKKFNLLLPFDWLHYNAVEALTLSNLNAHFFNGPMFDFGDSNNHLFINAYREKFKNEPNDVAYRAYFIMKLMNQALIHEGKFIQSSFNNDLPAFHKPENALGFENKLINYYYFQEHKLLKFEH